ncbi:unnamed protein product [Medioppia subpectinata]|uniref:Cytochrome P450 n=1 Tax=Medioppia subpectinata TaxID=1979941 RepID=A0A7R9KSX6_9ACAR|nr:unnamed protein product [Medioppia subpectinata]CAG2108924.1 unnamed protein product [Medioppia subpectinata]
MSIKYSKSMDFTHKVNALVSDLTTQLIAKEDYTQNILKIHENTYDESLCRDFCDMFIAAKRKAETECLPGVQWLTDVNVSATLVDLFIAGIETSFTTIQWLLLFMAYFEDWQQKLRVEIDEVLGDRVATMQDRPLMHCVQAFLAESLRYRTAAPIGSPRNTLLDTTIAGHPIASQTMVVQHTYNMSMNEKYWPRSSDFDPGRFLDKHVRPPAFIPFGTGRRVCIGESLALNIMFIFVVRFLQLTRDHPIRLTHKYRTDHTLEPLVNQNIFFLVPTDYEIVFEK